MTRAAYLRLVLRIRLLLLRRRRVIVAIDGRCGSGKTTLAAQLRHTFRCTVCHMDDFFLRPEQRTESRFATPGENVDHERFLEEVLLPLRRGAPFAYRPYVCAAQSLGDPVQVTPARLTVVEGAYACHPALWDHYDLRVFLTVPPDEQLRRIEKRNGPEKAQQFRTRWIPFEEKYFEAFQIQPRCDLTITSN